MRLFIAVNFPGVVRDSIAESAEAARAVVPGNYSPKDNYHVTLAFLGEVPDDGTAAIAGVMDELGWKKTKLKIGYYGSFGKGSSILWRKVFADGYLEAYREKLVESLRAKGFRIDGKAFRPHLTVAREIAADGPELRELSRRIDWPEFTADKVELMKSERINGKLVYTAVYSRRADDETG